MRRFERHAPTAHQPHTNHTPTTPNQPTHCARTASCSHKASGRADERERGRGRGRGRERGRDLGHEDVEGVAGGRVLAARLGGAALHEHLTPRQRALEQAHLHAHAALALPHAALPGEAEGHARVLEALSRVAVLCVEEVVVLVGELARLSAGRAALRHRLRAKLEPRRDALLLPPIRFRRGARDARDRGARRVDAFKL